MASKCLDQIKKRKFERVISKLDRQGYGCFKLNENNQVECFLCCIELKYIDIGTLKRHLGTVRHDNNVN